jgi:hypothetical protein
LSKISVGIRIRGKRLGVVEILISIIFFYLVVMVGVVSMDKRYTDKDTKGSTLAKR